MKRYPLLFLTVLLIGALGNAKGSVINVTISGMKYDPQNVDAKVGDTVIWKNADMFPHTATSKGHFDSKAIQPDKTFKMKLKKAGSFDYTCTFHPTMTGKILVH